MDFELFRNALNELDKDSAKKIFDDIIESKINEVKVIDVSHHRCSTKCGKCKKNLLKCSDCEENFRCEKCKKNTICDTCYSVFSINIMDYNIEIIYNISGIDELEYLKHELINDSDSISMGDNTYMEKDSIIFWDINDNFSKIYLFKGKEKIKEIKVLFEFNKRFLIFEKLKNYSSSLNLRPLAKRGISFSPSP